jgi:hypothetical protein
LKYNSSLEKFGTCKNRNNIKYGNYKLVVYSTFATANYQKHNIKVNIYRHINVHFNFAQALNILQTAVLHLKNCFKSCSGCSLLRSLVFVKASAETPAAHRRLYGTAAKLSEPYFSELVFALSL